MNKLVTIYCKNNQQYYQVPAGSTLKELLPLTGVTLKWEVIAARVNFRTQTLNYEIYKPKDIEFIDASSASGLRVYIRTLCMILARAVNDILPHALLVIDHSINHGYYCRVEGASLSAQMIEAIKQRMQEIVAEDMPIKRVEEQTERVLHLFRSKGRTDVVSLLETLNRAYTRYYEMNGFVDYYTGAMAASTGYIKHFDLTPCREGMHLRSIDQNNPSTLQSEIEQPKLFGILSEYKRWNALLGINTVGDFNKVAHSYKSDLIKVSEALQEKRISQIADMIAERDSCRFVMVSGPSSSDKTTFSKRLSVQLAVIGMHPLMLSLDDFFVNRENTPLDENGDWDFESLYALDLDLLNDVMNRLNQGQEVEIPTFNFITGQREWNNKKMLLKKDNILIIEGIHALNPNLCPHVPTEAMFKIYVSALTTISIDRHNWVSTTDSRLIRRIVRDHNFRGYSAADTIRRWPSVRKGEEKWIFPYQENADVMFNSALLFELAVLRSHAEPLLAQVPENTSEYNEACRLLHFLRYFCPITDDELPPTSLLREFLGGSSFKY